VLNRRVLRNESASQRECFATRLLRNASASQAEAIPSSHHNSLDCHCGRRRECLTGECFATRVLRNASASQRECFATRVLRNASASQRECFATRVLRNASASQAEAIPSSHHNSLDCHCSLLGSGILYATWKPSRRDPSTCHDLGPQCTIGEGQLGVEATAWPLKVWSCCDMEGR
jgi:hypothetical protein